MRGDRDNKVNVRLQNEDLKPRKTHPPEEEQAMGAGGTLMTTWTKRTEKERRRPSVQLLSLLSPYERERSSSLGFRGFQEA